MHQRLLIAMPYLLTSYFYLLPPGTLDATNNVSETEGRVA